MGVIVGRGIAANLVSRMLTCEEFVPFVAAAHPLTAQAHVSAGELAREHFLIPRGASESAEVVREALFDAGATMPSREHFAFPDCSTRTLISLVCQGNDIGLVAQRSTGLLAQFGGAALPCPERLIALPLSLVAREATLSRGTTILVYLITGQINHVIPIDTRATFVKMHLLEKPRDVSQRRVRRNLIDILSSVVNDLFPIVECNF